MIVCNVERIITGVVVKLTEDECKALVEVLGALSGVASDKTFSIYSQLYHITNQNMKDNKSE